MMTRTAPWVVVLLMLTATPARADWWVKGFGALTFARDSGFIDLEITNEQHKPLFGAAVGRRVRSLQIEGEVALSPQFFRDSPGVLDTGSLTTLTANVAWTLPVSARLSGYVIAGGGLARIAIADKLDAFSRTSNKFVANAGGGVVVRMTPRVDAFSELRYFRTNESDPTTISFGSEYLSYARFALGGRVRF